MKIATWNVNSLRVRLPQVQDWLKRERPEVLCLQETKLRDEDFPLEPIESLGYEVAFSGQKAYNGVAVLSRLGIEDVETGFPGFDDPQRRVLSAGTGPARILNLYVPNGEEVGSKKYEYKLDWLRHLIRYVKGLLSRHSSVVICGDFNIAPEDRDVYDPEAWRGRVLCSEPEREAFRSLLSVGFHDAFRKFEHPEGAFSWWDYRAGAFRRNMGLRIDHILCSDDLYARVKSCRIDKTPRELKRPSDHAPVIAEITG